MLSRIRTDYHHTIRASYLGYITQAIINNFAPLLLLYFQQEFSFTLTQITLLTTVNFAVQLCVDLASAWFVDRIGYRPCMIAAHTLAAAGLIGMAVLPGLLPSAYAGMMMAVVCYAIGGGLIEVLISPIVESCPTEGKESAMGLLHSFYCWGHVFLILVSTAFFAAFGLSSWRVLACLWAVIPLLNVGYFSLVPIYPIVPDGTPQMSLGSLMKNRLFWLLAVLMICAGASEQAMSQWASAFAESALHVSKTMGDLAGPCAFALLMGTSRALYGKFADRVPLTRAIVGCAMLCILCYLLAAFASLPMLGLVGCAVCGFSVGIFWPGTFSLAARSLPGGGTALFALLALAGDVGCSGGPTLVGLAANALGGSLHQGLALAILFPVLILVCMGALRRRK